MKNITIKNLKKGIALAAIACIGIAGVVNADSFLRKTGGAVDVLQLAPKSLENAFSIPDLGFPFFSSPTSMYDVIFRVAGTSFLDTLMVYNDAAFDALSIGFNNISGVNANAALNVDGKIKIGALADSDRPVGSLDPVCTNDFGVLERCNAATVVIPDPAVAACGSASGVMTGTPPTTNLCNPGTATTVNLVAGFYRWSCNEGTTTVDCSARHVNTAENGQCQSFPSAYTSQPANSTNACTAGTYVDTTDSATDWEWECQGSNGGTTDSCSASINSGSSGPDLGRYQCTSAGTWSPIGTCNPSTEFPAWNGGTTYAPGDLVCVSSAPANSTCVSGTGACEGTYTTSGTSGTTIEVDWNGDPFDWESGAIYSASGTLIAQCIDSNLSFGTITPTTRAYLRSTIGAFSPPYGPVIIYPNMDGQQLSHYCNRYENHETVMYTTGWDGQWRRLNANTVGWESQIMSIDRLGNYFQNSGGSTGGTVRQCSTLTSYGESYCEENPANSTCTWNPNG